MFNKSQLCQIQALEKEGAIELFDNDESGFCLISAIPYGWQFPGEHVATQPRHSPRFNVLGLFNATTKELHTAAREGTLDAAFLIDTLDAWVATRTRPTVLVLNNARLHHAATFQARLQGWEDHDVPLFYLPTCCPHLNKIETRGRQVKYEWLQPEATADCKTLKTAVWHIPDRVGLPFTSQFATGHY